MTGVTNLNAELEAKRLRLATRPNWTGSPPNAEDEASDRPCPEQQAQSVREAFAEEAAQCQAQSAPPQLSTPMPPNMRGFIQPLTTLQRPA